MPKTLNDHNEIKKICLDALDDMKAQNVSEIDIEKFFLDSEYYLTDFKGDISINNNEIQKANLIGSFSKNKKLKFTINSVDNDFN